MKIVKSIVNALTKAEAKRGVASVATVRQDTVRKAIERGEFEKIKCAYSMTDDYAWDAVNNNGWKDNVGQETMAREYSILTPSCWVSPKKFIINGIECYEISISFHSNLAYDMYVPVDGKKSEPVVKEEEKKVEAVKEVEQVEVVEEKKYIVMNAQDTCDWSEGNIEHVRQVVLDNWDKVECDTLEEYDALLKHIPTADIDDLDLEMCLEQIEHRVFCSYEEMLDWRRELGMEVDEDEEPEENKCTFCGKTDTCDTKNVGGYEVLESCTDCEKEILEGNEEDEVPEELYLCNGCDEMYHEEMSEGECCEGKDFRIVSKGDMGFHD
ncbi:hypothetical protein [Bacillus paranthracis]|uniref:hypothetical protein n=1 Tax=Bacillus paranthracis TaxID=2026186 RepID=UPI002D77E2BD|nr:hypothetical protein [Bacillus paranthracis]